MPAINEITGASIVSKSSEAYRDNYDRIFRKENNGISDAIFGKKEDILDRISSWQKSQGIVGAMPIHVLVSDCYNEIKSLREQLNTVKECK